MDIERNLGRQPLADILEHHQLKPHDLVAQSDQFLTHKMVSRALKGRRLTTHSKLKVQQALNKATGQNFKLDDLFNYR